MYCAVVEKVVSTYNTVEMFVRFRRSHLLKEKRKSFAFIVHRNDFRNTPKAYETLKALRPGDEIFVDGYGQEWSHPHRYGKVKRWWNKHFG